MRRALAAALLLAVLATLAALRGDGGVPGTAPLGGPLGWLLRGGASVHHGAAQWFGGVFAAERLAEENESLRRELAKLRAEAATGLAHGIAEAARERLATTLPQMEEAPLVTAHVLGTAPGARRGVLWIDAGAAQGLARGMPVFGPEGIVGAIDRVHGNSALVLLASDKAARWSVLSGTSGEYGVLVGTGNAGEAELQFESTTPATQVGETIVTSGLAGSVAPGGLPFGTVKELRRNRSGAPVAVVDLPAEPETLRTLFVLTGTVQQAWEPPTR